MRNIIALCCLSLTGCVSAPFSVSPATNQPVATLTLGARTGYPISQGYDGIWSVDGQDIPKGPVQSIFVAPGKRAIGYICPGWLSMDGPPTLSHVFEADRRYEINCEKDPRIDPVLDNAQRPGRSGPFAATGALGITNGSRAYPA